MNWLAPGTAIEAAARSELVVTEASAVEKAQAGLAARGGSITIASFVEMFFPANWLTSLADPNLQILPLIAFALLCGMAATKLNPAQRGNFIAAMDLMARIGTQIVDFALALAPWAVACLMASAVIRFGASVLGPLLIFVFAVLAVMAVHLFGTMTLLLKLFSRVRPRDFFRAVRTVLLTAFSTSSSNATLPTSLRVAREDLGVSAPTAGFVLPLGATMNMSGTALYEGCVVLFVAQAYGLSLDLAQQAMLVLLTVLSAVAVSGIPGASLPLIVGLLGTFGIPAEGLALVLGFDRILDMARTVLNVAADLVTAVIVDEPEAAVPPQ
jgi:DAACS family dicarboxylate/amino acid:cation (Na+ or H+) symporter